MAPFFTDPTLTIGGVTYNTVLADRDSVPTAYAPATLTWSQPTGLDGPDAATFTADVTVPIGYPRPQLLAPVYAAVSSAGSGANPVFVGAVDTLRRTVRTFRNPDGSTFDVEVLRVTAIDWLGILARRKIGDEPWPEELWGERVARIVALTSDLPWATVPMPNALPPVTVAPRDVDASGALELLRSTLAGVDFTLRCGADGLDIVDRAQTTVYPDLIVVPAGGTAEVRQGDSPFAVTLPARAVVDQDRVLDYDLVVNRATVTYKSPPESEDADWTDTTLVYRDEASIQAYGETSFGISSDATEPSRADAVARWLLRSATPKWRLAGAVELILDRTRLGFNAYLVSVLLHPTFRTGMCLSIDGAPEDDLRAVRIIGGTLTYGSEADEALTLTPEPFTLAAPLGLRFIDTQNVSAGGDVTFAEMGALTFADAQLVSTIIRES